MTHVAERAATGADVAHDHEGGGAFTKAFADVRAAGLFTYGVQLLLTQDLFDLEEALTTGDLGTDPLRLFQLFFQRNDLDGDARGLGFAFVFHSGRVINFHAVSLLTLRWR